MSSRGMDSWKICQKFLYQGARIGYPLLPEIHVVFYFLEGNAEISMEKTVV